MNSTNSISDQLLELAEAEFDSVREWIQHLPASYHVPLLIEACRVLDYWYVREHFSDTIKDKLFVADFSIITWGWNPLLGMLLPYTKGMKGIPLKESTEETRKIATTVLHQLGRYSLLKQAATMLIHNMAEAKLENDCIIFNVNKAISSEGFLNQIEKKEYSIKEATLEQLAKEYQVENVKQRIENLVFPWNTDCGIMVGYDADPFLDDHFLAMIMQNISDWRDEAGIHPEAKIKDISGAQLIGIGSIIISLYLKHIYFVGIGSQKIPNINYPMSLTIWRLRSEIVKSISYYTQISETDVSNILELFIIKREHQDYFLKENTTFIPMFIEISDNQLLSPVSSIFKNPFDSIRMLGEWHSEKVQTSIREPREKWMISDLYALFQGNRYRCSNGTKRIKKGKLIVTDIDAAVFDRTTGELALFQLKWQDFTTSDLIKQRSKAKNFVQQTDSWFSKVRDWINEFGEAALCKSLGLKIDMYGEVSAIRMFAIGRSASRFQAYGYTSKFLDLAICSWPEFVRHRLSIGSSTNVLKSIFDVIKEPIAVSIKKSALPYEIKTGDQKVLFENMWFSYE